MKKKHISNLITLASVLLFVWYGLTNQEVFQALKDVALWSLVLVAAGKLLVFVSNGLFTQWTAEVFTKKFSFVHGVYITVLSAVGNFFGPLLGGASIRAVYLKKYHNLPYSKFTATLMGYYMMLFMANAALAIISLILLPKTHQTSLLLIFFSMWLLALIALMFIKLPKREKFANSGIVSSKLGSSIIKILYDVEEGWQLLIRNKQLLIKMTGLALLSLSATLFISFIEFQALHISYNFAALGLYTSLVAVSLLVSITPGAIGIRESMLILVSTTLGITNAEIIQVAVIDRGVHFLLLAVLFLLTRNSSFRRSLMEQ